MKILGIVFAGLCMVAGQLAGVTVTVTFFSPTTSVNYGTTYSVGVGWNANFEWWEDWSYAYIDAYIYRDYSQIASTYSQYGGSMSINQNDTGPQVIEYFAEAYLSSYYGSSYDSAYHYVTISGPPNQAPIGVRDYHTTSLNQSATLQATGWAADPEMGAPITRVDILIDGNDVADATLGGSRPDIASAYGRSDYTNSGWSVNYNIGALSFGSHTLAFKAWDNQGASTTFGSTTFTVLNSAPSVTLTSPSSQTIAMHASLTLSTNATDLNGDITVHRIEIQRPNATWNWQGGFASGEPYIGGPFGSAANSTRSASFTFNIAGTWHVRAWVSDSQNQTQLSSTAVITVTDTEAPSTPSGLSASAIATGSFILSWNPSSDNVAVTGYRVFRNGADQVDVTAPTTTLAVSGLSHSTTYQMTVSARDLAGNWSSPSSNLPVTTASPPPGDASNNGIPDWMESALTTSTAYGVAFNISQAATDNLTGALAGSGAGLTKLNAFYPGK